MQIQFGPAPVSATFAPPLSQAVVAPTVAVVTPPMPRMPACWTYRLAKAGASAFSRPALVISGWPAAMVAAMPAPAASAAAVRMTIGRMVSLR